jgi:hypothetical protein
MAMVTRSVQDKRKRTKGKHNKGKTKGNRQQRRNNKGSETKVTMNKEKENRGRDIYYMTIRNTSYDIRMGS